MAELNDSVRVDLSGTFFQIQITVLVQVHLVHKKRTQYVNIVNGLLCIKLFAHIAKGLCKEKNSKNPRLLWKWVGGLPLGIFFFKSSQKINSPKLVLIFWSTIPCVFCLYTLLKVVGYYDLSVLSMSVMGFKKKSLDGGWVGGVSSIQKKLCLEFF